MSACASTLLEVWKRKSWPRAQVMIFVVWSLVNQRSIGSDSQGRVTAANNQRQLDGENKKPFNYLPLHVNTNKSKEMLHPSASAPTTPAVTKETKKQSPGRRETLSPVGPRKESPRMSRCGTDRGLLTQREYGRLEPKIDSSQVMLCC